jgi:hypothetical protein
MIVTACGPEHVRFTFDNRTDAVLCQYRTQREVALNGCSADIDPQRKTQWERGCDSNDDRLIQVIIILEEDGREIYDKTATCGAWLDTDRTFVIERPGQDFIVTDPFAAK